MTKRSDYSVLSAYYDKLSGDYDYSAYYRAVEKYIDGSVVELGAGSGKFTVNYIGKASSVQLVEQSEGMLAECMNKLLRYRRKCVFLQSDMRLFKPIKKADTVLAVCDVLNYTDNLNGIIENIAGYIKTGGYFIFDISSEYKLKSVIGDNIFYEDLEDVTYIWTNSLMDNAVDMELTFFEKKGDGYTRRDESHRQYIHKDKDIEDALHEHFAFTKLDGDSFDSVRANSLRVLYICRRK